MVATVNLVAQAICVLLVVPLVVLMAWQLYIQHRMVTSRHVRSRSMSSRRLAQSSSIWLPPPGVGNVQYVVVRPGLAISLLLLTRALDPQGFLFFPILPLSLFSFNATAIFYFIGAWASYVTLSITAKVENTQIPRWLLAALWLTAGLIFVAANASALYLLFDNSRLWGLGLVLAWNSVATVIILVINMYAVVLVKRTIQSVVFPSSATDVMKNQHRERSKAAIDKLNVFRNIVIAVCTVALIPQVLISTAIILDGEGPRIDEGNPDTFEVSLWIFYWAQILALYILLWFAWYPMSKIPDNAEPTPGTSTRSSEQSPSKNPRTSVQLNLSSST